MKSVDWIQSTGSCRLDLVDWIQSSGSNPLDPVDWIVSSSSVAFRLNQMEKGKSHGFWSAGHRFADGLDKRKIMNRGYFPDLDQHVRIGEDNGRVGVPLGVV